MHLWGNGKKRPIPTTIAWCDVHAQLPGVVCRAARFAIRREPVIIGQQKNIVLF
jgi:hypothetical protein